MSNQRLDWNATVAAVDALAGRRVSMRVVLAGNPETLVVVFHGHLEAAQRDKEPSLFWPLDGQAPDDLEQAGLYLSEADFDHTDRRAGGILVIRRGTVLPLAG